MAEKTSLEDGDCDLVQYLVISLTCSNSEGQLSCFNWIRFSLLFEVLLPTDAMLKNTWILASNLVSEKKTRPY